MGIGLEGLLPELCKVSSGKDIYDALMINTLKAKGNVYIPPEN